MGLGPRGHEGGRPPAADDPAEPRLRPAGPAADDQAERDARLRRRPAVDRVGRWTNSGRGARLRARVRVRPKGVLPMESSTSPKRVLVVAHRTAATPALLDTVRNRAASSPATFTLLVPNSAHGLHRVVDPEDQEESEAQTVLDLAIPLLEEAAGGHVEGLIGDPEPLNAIQDAINLHGFDEIIISTLPTRVSRWLRLDLPSKAEGLGLPVTTVTAKDRV